MKINFLHRLRGQLQVAILGGRQTLAGWARQFLGTGAGEVDGYFTTKGGRILNSQALVAELLLHPTQEVVLQVRLRGGGYSGGGKGTRGAGVPHPNLGIGLATTAINRGVGPPVAFVTGVVSRGVGAGRG